MLSMDFVKKRIIISMIAIILLVITLFGITYAYFIAKVQGNTNDRSVSVSAGVLRLTYGDGNSNIIANKIIPGTVITKKTFTVKNTGTSIVENYDVILENVVNELENYEDLTYVLTCKSDDNKECIGSEGVFPTSQYVIATNDIDVDVTHSYELVITYKETNTDQSMDMNKNIDAKVNIKDDISNIKKLNIYGNSVQDGTPIPTSPVSIVSLGDKNNLFDNNINATNIEKSGNDILVKGYAVGVDIKPSEFLEMTGLDIGDTFTIKRTFNVEKGTGNTVTGDIIFLKSSSGITSFELIDASQKINTVEIPSDFTDENYIGLYFYGANKADLNGERLVRFSNVQIVEGEYAEDTIPEYESYDIYKIPITVETKNEINLDSTSDLSNWSHSGNYDVYNLNLEVGKTYTLLYNVINNSFINSNDSNSLMLLYSNQNIHSIYNNSIEIEKKEFTFTADGTEQLRIYSPNYTSQSELDLLMSDLGEFRIIEGEYKSYTKYIYLDAPLRKIGDYADYIDYENNKIVRYIKEDIIDSSATWNVAGDYTLNRTFYSTVFKNDIIANNDSTLILSNKFKTTDAALWNDPSEAYLINIGSTDKSIYVTLPTTVAETTAQVKEYFTDDPLIINYVLANPELETINLPVLNVNEEQDISVCDRNNICASKIEIEFDS